MDGQVIHVGEFVYCIAAGQSGHEFGQSQVAGQIRTEPDYLAALQKVSSPIAINVRIPRICFSLS